eukprot:2547156-Prymnesium_polylepis.1
MRAPPEPSWPARAALDSCGTISGGRSTRGATRSGMTKPEMIAEISRGVSVERTAREARRREADERG